MSTSLKLVIWFPFMVRSPFVAAGPLDEMVGVHMVVATRPRTPVLGSTPHWVGTFEPLVPESYSSTLDPAPMVSVVSPNKGTPYRPLMLTVSCTSRVMTPPAGIIAVPTESTSQVPLEYVAVVR